MKRLYWNCIITLITVYSFKSDATYCGCKLTRSCYTEMIEILKSPDETPCIENSNGGEGTLLVYFKAVEKYCPQFVTVLNEKQTYEGRYLYEIIIESKSANEPDTNKPVILLEAGQEAGVKASAFAMFIIQQLLACQENVEMIERAKWVILPSTNPDGKHVANDIPKWRKNNRIADDKWSFGVDISRNFDNQWSSCESIDNPWSPNYPGPQPMSENETIFIRDTINKYKTRLKAYVSIRRDGHAILYPNSYTKNSPLPTTLSYRVAANIATRVNQRAVGVNLFLNTSIFEFHGKASCGNSVDMVHDMDIPLAYEMRVFYGSDLAILSKFQPMPRGLDAQLRAGYFGGIRELYSAVVNEKRYANGGRYFI